MRGIKKYLHILLALLLAAGGGGAAYTYIQANTPSVNVVKINAKIPPGTVITGQHIHTQRVAKAILPPDAVTRPEEALGKTLTMTVLGEDILRKEHIVAGKGSLVARLSTVAPGKVAVDLPQEAAQGLIGLEIGDKVNVYGEVALATADGKAATTVDKVAVNATILSAPLGEEKMGQNQAIILACDPQEEQQIARVLAGGKKVTLFLQQGGK